MPGPGYELLYSATTVQLIATSGIAGDFDFDGDVDGFDFLTWQWDPSIGALSDWQANYGMSFPPPVNAATVPEPTAIVLLGFAIGSVATLALW